MNTTECIFFLHACRNTTYFKGINKESFKDIFIRELFSLTREFHNSYGELPFTLEGVPNLEQVEEVLKTNKQHYLLDEELSSERNYSIFIENAEVILSNDYNRYVSSYIDESIKAWIDWENFQLAYVRASTYMKTMDVTPSTYKEVIGEAQQILQGFSYVGNEEDAVDFFDPETHKTGDDELGYKTSWENWDLFLNDSGSGVKEGNLIILVGAPNIGKTIFLGNIAYEYVVSGHNVLFVSLEMKEQDMAKRIGSNAFNIEMDDYDSHRENISDHIENWDMTHKSETRPRGEFLMKRMYDPTSADINNAVLKEEKERGIKIHIVVLDYFTEMGSLLNIRKDNAFNVYQYHKQNAKELFDNSGKNGYTTITAHQSSAIDPLAEDIYLSDLSESKGILHSPDGVVGIIQSSSMKGVREYKLKNLKPRHSKYKDFYLNFNIDYQHMRLKCLDMDEPSVFSPDD